jgi:hypothetical protein
MGKKINLLIEKYVAVCTKGIIQILNMVDYISEHTISPCKQSTLKTEREKPVYAEHH